MRILKNHPLCKLVDSPSSSPLYCYINVNKTKIITVILIIITLTLISICFNIVIPFVVCSITIYLARLNPLVEYYFTQIICVIIGYYSLMFSFAILDLLGLLPEFLYINGGSSNNQNLNNHNGQPGSGGQPGGSGPNNNFNPSLSLTHNQSSTNDDGQPGSAGQPVGDGTNNQGNPYINLSPRQLREKLRSLTNSIE
jgi:hypothetical protein